MEPCPDPLVRHLGTHLTEQRVGAGGPAHLALSVR